MKTMVTTLTLLILLVVLAVPASCWIGQNPRRGVVSSLLGETKSPSNTRFPFAKVALEAESSSSPSSSSPSSSFTPPPPVQPSEEAQNLKRQLLEKITTLRELQRRDGSLSIDFGVRGGELNQTSRAPQKVDYYAVSDDVGKAADDVMDVSNRLADVTPIARPTMFLGDADNGRFAPLNGAWKLLFTTAADASFSSNSTRGAATAQNVVDAEGGRITNVIDFLPKPDGSERALKQLNVNIRATAVSDTRVKLEFKYAKAVLTKFFGLPLFGRTLPLYIPVPATFITRCVVFLSRIVKFGRGGAKKIPMAYFDVLYLDDDLRIHRTGEDNLFVQAKESWIDAKPLLE